MSTLLDDETVVLEHLDFEVPCQVGEHAAHVSIACRSCRDQAFYCRDHWEAKRRRVDEFLRSSIFAVVVCAACKLHAHSIEDLVEVIEL